MRTVVSASNWLVLILLPIFLIRLLPNKVIFLIRFGFKCTKRLSIGVRPEFNLVGGAVEGPFPPKTLQLPPPPPKNSKDYLQKIAKYNSSRHDFTSQIASETIS